MPFHPEIPGKQPKIGLRIGWYRRGSPTESKTDAGLEPPTLSYSASPWILEITRSPPDKDVDRGRSWARTNRVAAPLSAHTHDG